MKKLLTLTILAVMLALGANGAWADGPFPTPMTDGTYGPAGSVTPNSNTGEVEIYNEINLLLGTSYTNNAQIDNLEYTGNTSTWQQTGNGGYAVIGLGAGASNSLDVYNVNTPTTLISPLGTGFSGNQLEGTGQQSNPFPAAGSVFAPGTQFGFALNSVYGSNTTTWYSNPALNSDSYNHMLTYYLPQLSGTTVYVYDPTTNTEQPIVLEDPYILAFEDTPEGPGAPSDNDYNDLVVLVDGVAPVPEPMTLALFGFALFVIAGFALRRKFALAS